MNSCLLSGTTMALHLRRASRDLLMKRVTSRNSAFVNFSSRRSLVSATVPLAEKKTLNVPTMGDSITEGTIVEWSADPGQAVKEGDVVAMVETDKVTVEIKAEMDGVVTQHFGAVDDTVEVGSPLYELDTEAVASVAAAAAATEVAAPSTTMTASSGRESEDGGGAGVGRTGQAEATPSETAGGAQRVPSIQFLGRDGWAARLRGEQREATSTEKTSLDATPKSTLDVTQLDGSVIGPMYGRPLFSEEEMEALIMGGASIAPEVTRYSKGATFK